MQDFRNLKVWQKAHDLTLSVYKVASRFPREELFALASQLKKAASSIGANIAEGCGRSSDADFGRFLFIAMGSASEVENHLELARDLGFISQTDYDELQTRVIEIKRMISALIQRTHGKAASG